MILEVFVRFLPIFFLLVVGYILKKCKVLNEEVIGGVKKIIVNAALPAILFISFLTMEIHLRYLFLFGATFVFCLILYGAGILFYRTGLCRYPLSPFFFTGFEFGMVGVALFTSLFGAENLHYILLLGLGHEFFIWFVYAPLLESQNTGRIHIGEIVKSFFKSPIIIAIITALFLNLTGIYNRIETNAITGGMISSLKMLAAIVTPLILLTIGSQLSLKNIEWKPAGHLISLRLIVVGIFGTLLILFTGSFVMEIENIMLYAFLIFFLIPPPFIIPVFLGRKYENEILFYNNLLILYTLVSLVVLILVMLVAG